MKPLSFPALWRDTIADTRALLPLAFPIAAAFVMLPGVVIDRFGPPVPQVTVSEVRVAPGAPAGRPAARPTATRPALPSLPTIPPNVLLVDLVLPALIGLVAQAAIIRLTLDRRRGVARSVGEALTAAVRAWPLLVATLALSAIPIGLGIMAFVVPGLYLAGRLTPAVAFVLDGLSPVAALERSWALTAGNGWRVIGFTLVFAGWFVIVSVVTGAVGAAAAGLLATAGAAGAGAVVAATLDGAVAALAALVNAVALATVYRHLR